VEAVLQGRKVFWRLSSEVLRFLEQGLGLQPAENRELAQGVGLGINGNSLVRHWAGKTRSRPTLCAPLHQVLAASVGSINEHSERIRASAPQQAKSTPPSCYTVDWPAAATMSYPTRTLANLRKIGLKVSAPLGSMEELEADHSMCRNTSANSWFVLPLVGPFKTLDDRILLTTALAPDSTLVATT